MILATTVVAMPVTLGLTIMGGLSAGLLVCAEFVARIIFV
jgi:hypothetical protein